MLGSFMDGNRLENQSPAKPPEYDSLVWRYFDAIDNPVGFIAAQFEKGGCKRCEILRPLVRFSARGGRTAK